MGRAHELLIPATITGILLGLGFCLVYVLMFMLIERLIRNAKARSVQRARTKQQIIALRQKANTMVTQFHRSQAAINQAALEAKTAIMNHALNTWQDEDYYD